MGATSSSSSNNKNDDKHKRLNNQQQQQRLRASSTSTSSSKSNDSEKEKEETVVKKKKKKLCNACAGSRKSNNKAKKAIELPQPNKIPQQQQQQVEPLKFKKTLFEHDYAFTNKLIGKGMNSRNGGGVFLCIKRSNEKRFAVKKVFDMPESRREASLQYLASQSCENICKVIDAYTNGRWLFIVMEYMRGGELFDRIVKRQSQFSEREVARIMQQIANAVHHLHSMNIAHRDLKPENILLMDKEETSLIKLADFGFAKRATDGLKSPTYTLNYVAPEVLIKSKSRLPFQHYDVQCDIWSLGVIMFILCSGYPPFYVDAAAVAATPTTAMKRRIMSGAFDFNQSVVWDSISHECKELIRQMLEVDPDKRITIEQFMQSKWLRNSQTISNAPLRAQKESLNKIVRDKKYWAQVIDDMESALREKRVIWAQQQLVQELDENKVSFLIKRKERCNEMESSVANLSPLKLVIPQSKSLLNVNERKSSSTNNKLIADSRPPPSSASQQDIMKKSFSNFPIGTVSSTRGSGGGNNLMTMSKSRSSILVALHYSTLNLHGSHGDEEKEDSDYDNDCNEQELKLATFSNKPPLFSYIS